MIRRMTQEDVDAVGEIWLTASLEAHDFVPAAFWRGELDTMTAEILPGSHGYVHETERGIGGSAALGSGPRSSYMGALFVSPHRQSQGIGSQLVDHVKAMRDSLDANVYKQNHRALEFYRSQGFRVVDEQVCQHTGCEEYCIRWTREPEQSP